MLKRLLPFILIVLLLGLAACGEAAITTDAEHEGDADAEIQVEDGEVEIDADADADDIEPGDEVEADLEADAEGAVLEAEAADDEAVDEDEIIDVEVTEGDLEEAAEDAISAADDLAEEMEEAVDDATDAIEAADATAEAGDSDEDTIDLGEELEEAAEDVGLIEEDGADTVDAADVDFADAEALQLEGDAERGDELFHEMYEEVGFACATCHHTDREDQLIGPGLLNIVERADDRVEGLTADQYIYQSITRTDAYIVEGYPENLMPQTYDELFTPQEIADIMAYLHTFE